ncbi:MAG: hypothetical protein RL682_1901, partial [Pseudomonadota bacterium]
MTAGGTYFDIDPAGYRQKVFRTNPRAVAFDALTCTEFFAHWSNQYVSFNTYLATDLAVHLGLEDHIGKPLYMLSTGSKRKMWLAAAFACEAVVT